jgi:hypothetical protein
MFTPTLTLGRVGECALVDFIWVVSGDIFTGDCHTVLLVVSVDTDDGFCSKAVSWSG